MKSGILLIALERHEQIEKHGRTVEKDVKINTAKELAFFAALLLSVEWEEVIDPDSYPDGWDATVCLPHDFKAIQRKINYCRGIDSRRN